MWSLLVGLQLPSLGGTSIRFSQVSCVLGATSGLTGLSFAKPSNNCVKQEKKPILPVYNYVYGRNPTLLNFHSLLYFNSLLHFNFILIQFQVYKCQHPRIDCVYVYLFIIRFTDSSLILVGIFKTFNWPLNIGMGKPNNTPVSLALASFAFMW